MAVGCPKIGGAELTVETCPLVKSKLKDCTAAEPKLGTITKPSDEAEYVLLQASSMAIASTITTANTPAHLLDILRFISMFPNGLPIMFPNMFLGVFSIRVSLHSRRSAGDR